MVPGSECLAPLFGMHLVTASTLVYRLMNKLPVKLSAKANSMQYWIIIWLSNLICFNLITARFRSESLVHFGFFQLCLQLANFPYSRRSAVRFGCTLRVAWYSRRHSLPLCFASTAALTLSLLTR